MFSVWAEVKGKRQLFFVIISTARIESIKIIIIIDGNLTTDYQLNCSCEVTQLLSEYHGISKDHATAPSFVDRMCNGIDLIRALTLQPVLLPELSLAGEFLSSPLMLS